MYFYKYSNIYKPRNGYFLLFYLLKLLAYMAIYNNFFKQLHRINSLSALFIILTLPFLPKKYDEHKS